MAGSTLILNNLGNQGPNFNDCTIGLDDGCLLVGPVAKIPTTDEMITVSAGFELHVDLKMTIADAFLTSQDKCWSNQFIEDPVEKDRFDAMFDTFTQYEPFNVNQNLKDANGFLQINLANGKILPLNISLVPSCCTSQVQSVPRLLPSDLVPQPAPARARR